MNLLQRFVSFIREENLIQPKDLLMVAVSGGVDSVVLCELCQQAGYNFIMAHCNFQLRGEESKRDEQFVRQLSVKYKVPLLLKVFDTTSYAKENNLSIQVTARELRYSWFNEILENTPDKIMDAEITTPGGNEQVVTMPATSPVSGSAVSRPACLLTAHHADDNIETMLMNLFKGTGIAGLRGILPKQGKIIRPLLFAHREEIMDFCRDNNLTYVEDSSNKSDKYTRNYFRLQLLPAIQKVFPRVEENLAKNLNRFREIEQLYQQSIEQHKKKLLEIKGNEVHIPALKLKKLKPLESIIYEIIKEYGFTPPQTREVIDLLQGQSGKYVQSTAYRVIKNRNWLIISPVDTIHSQTIIINKGTKKLVFEKGQLEFKELPVNNCQLSASAEIAQLDADEIIFPLLLRKRKQGDYFYPLGMQKKKKLSRFLSDQKLSLTAKEQVWILEMNKKIIWITGHRIDDRFKITAKTTRVLQVTFTTGDSK